MLICLIPSSSMDSSVVFHGFERGELPRKGNRVKHAGRNLAVSSIAAFESNKIDLQIPDLPDFHLEPSPDQLQIDDVLKNVAYTGCIAQNRVKHKTY